MSSSVEKQMDTMVGLGLMSGTSLDGLDLALCRFHSESRKWRYEVLKCDTVSYSEELRQRLAAADRLSGLELFQLDRDFAAYMAEQVNDFLKNVPQQPDFIASHGQTIFHQPEKGLTVQIGSGAVISARTGIKTVCDFRTTDVALGGQGAPLVPIGDELLYGNYDGCLNLGGFSNISFNRNEKRIAFDVSPCNLLLNALSSKMGLLYDKNGTNAREGYIFRPLLEKLDALDFYQKEGAKSLGKEWLDEVVEPLFASVDICVIDQLRTATEHIARQIASVLNRHKIKSLLVTGGGTKNAFLMDRIRFLAPETMVVIPDDATVDFKEAIIFAFLGLLRLTEVDNCLKSVTGARKDNCGGAIYY